MNKQVGCLLGLHIGDSLGATLEFKKAKKRDDFHTEIVGGGDFNWKAGEPTDDTDMMLMLLESLSINGDLNLNDLSLRFIEWKKSGPKDIGDTTYRAIENLQRGSLVCDSGMKNEMSQGNGSLMRCAPLSLLAPNTQMICNQASITHAHPVCVLADQIFIQSIQDAYDGMSKQDIYLRALGKIPKKFESLKKAMQIVPLIDWEELKTSGYVVHTLTAAFWGLLKTESFEQSVIEVVNRGDDADTCGAVTGALCGAYYGLDSIPERWLVKIQEKQKIVSLTHKIIKLLH